jgi:protein SCO1/2
MRSLLLLLAACGGADTYIVEGVVVDVRSPTEVVVDHAEIPGLMGAMVMPFRVAPGATPTPLTAGDRIYARLETAGGASTLTKVRVVGHDPSREQATDAGPGPVRPGATLPQAVVSTPDGGRVTVGVGQDLPTVLTFLYTTCPLPEFCPATTRRLQELQDRLTGVPARLVAVTIDPAHDTPEVLTRYAASVGARPDRWVFGRLEGAELERLAAAAALSVAPGTRTIEHNTRFLVLDKAGVLIERYDDSRFPADRVIEQLRTGGPPAPVGSDGTVTPRE